MSETKPHPLPPKKPLTVPPRHRVGSYVGAYTRRWTQI